MTSVKMYQVDMTPDLAKVFLGYNVNNRNLSEKRVAGLAKAMVDGSFRLNGDTIRLAGDRLLDGQHRLHAVVRSGATVPMLIVEGLNEAVFDTIDIGKARSTGDTLSSLGYKSAKSLASALRYIRIINAGRAEAFKSETVSNADVAHDVAKYPDAVEALNQIRRYSRPLIPPGLAAALWALMGRKDTQLAATFFGFLLTGLGLPPASPAHVLRERLITNAASSRKLEVVAISALTIKAWNAHRTNTSIRVLRWGDSEVFPNIV